MPLTHIDCFSGPGGICAGLKAANFDTRIAIEYIQSCVDTYTANHPNVHVICSDITTVTADEILPYIPDEGVDLVTSGMPCETFSTAGNTSRSFYDERQFLFREGIRIAQIAKAKFILFENVPAIKTKTVTKDSSELIIDILKNELDAAGYMNHMEFILDASKYGVPQKRNRFFILATRFPGVQLSAPAETTQIPVTVEQALAGLKNVIPNTGKEEKNYTGVESQYSLLLKNDLFWNRVPLKNPIVTYHMPMRHRKCTIQRFALLEQGESLKDLFVKFVGEERKSLQDKRILPKKMFIKRNYRLKLYDPAPTVTSHCLDEFVHPLYNRALTVRECARLQSFPDSYDFCGGPYLTPHLHNDIQDKYEQIGDAVPPLLAYAWGLKINELFNNYRHLFIN